MNNNRRKFIQKSALTAAGLTILPHLVWSHNKTAPSDKINVGLIGCKNKGFKVLVNHLDTGDVNCLGMCDVNKNILEERAAEIKKDFVQTPKLYGDYRKMLEDKDIDAVIVGTPDHWHCLPTVHACQAGKDVYVEKPMANTIEECNVMMKAARKYDRVIQVGQQHRSGKLWFDVMGRIKSGDLGTISKVNIWANFSYGLGMPKKPNQPVPEGIDYDFWLGPAPVHPYNPSRFLAWRHFWDYGGGLMTDWGPHLLDMALWAKDVTYGPTEVMATGDNYTHLDYNRETFATLSVIYKMKDYVITWDQNAAAKTGPYEMGFGVEFVGDKGTIVADRMKWFLIQGGQREDFRPEVDYPHVENFIECIRTRNEPNCPPEVGRNAAVYSHMGNIVARSGEGKLVWDDEKNIFTNSKAANDYIKPEYRKPWKFPEV